MELRFESYLAAPVDAVWERAMALSGANDELWPLARMTFPIPLDSHTPAEQLVGHEFRSWTLGLGFIPVTRRTIRIKAFEVGRFHECSSSWALGNQCHERTAVEAADARPF